MAGRSCERGGGSDRLYGEVEEGEWLEDDLWVWVVLD